LKFIQTPITGAYVIELQRVEDERGFFARTWCSREFSTHHLNGTIAQCSISHNYKRGTLRGMHYQAAPCAEAKLVACMRGAIYDVIVDAREGSPTEGQLFATHLTPDEYRMLYVPEGVAHGFQTLVDHTDVTYMITVPYEANFQMGFRWNDVDVGIPWPMQPTCISERDATLPPFKGRASR